MHSEALHVRLQELEAKCREKGLPVTVQRRIILEAVLLHDDHPTADQVFEMVKDRIPRLSRTTVYRVLDTLAELGLVRRLQPSGTSRFDGNVQRHHHLVCTRCNKVIDLEDETLDRLPVPRRNLQGFKIDGFSVHFSGICQDCRKRKR